MIPSPPLEREHAMRRAARRALLTLASLAVILPVTTAWAQSTADTTGYVTSVRFGDESPCLSCPPVVCPGEPVPVTIQGILPDGCVHFLGARLVENAGPLPLISAEFSVDTCGVACVLERRPFSQVLRLPPYAPGQAQVIFQQAVRTCADTTRWAYLNRRVMGFTVRESCAPPVFEDSLIRGFTKLSVVPAEPCLGDTIRIRIAENGCPPCVHLTSFEFSPLRQRYIARLEWTPECAELRCASDTLDAFYRPVAPGLQEVRVLTEAVIHRPGGSDSIYTFERVLSFDVRQSCPPHGTGCLDPRLPPAAPPVPGCALSLLPGTRGEVVLPVHSGVSASGVQGSVFVQGPFRIVDLRYAGPASGVLLSWQLEPGGARFLVFGGQSPLIPAGGAALLRVTLASDSAASLGTTGSIRGMLTLASDAAGHEVPLCAYPLDARPPVLPLCIGSPEPSCDANGDQRLDVRDLVLMIGCLRPAASDTLRPGVCRDCDANGVFGIEDVLCCATRILRGPGVPRDSVTVTGDVAVSIVASEDAGPVLPVRLQVRGASGLGAALLRVRYPAAGWRLVPPPVTLDPAVPRGWLPLEDTSEPGLARIGAIRLEPDAVDELEQKLYLERIPGGEPGGEIRVEAADLTLPDGGLVAPALALPSALLPAGAIPFAIVLSQAHPNPFSTGTDFVVSLPGRATVELAIHDIAGRRVATLLQGALEAGAHTLHWDGSGARDGVYFARLTIGGRIYTSRVALLKNGR